MWASTVAAALAILAGLILIAALACIVTLMRRIAKRLAAIRLLLYAIALRTEPVPELVAGIGSNVATIHSGVISLEQATGRRIAPSGFTATRYYDNARASEPGAR